VGGAFRHTGVVLGVGVVVPDPLPDPLADPLADRRGLGTGTCVTVCHSLQVGVAAGESGARATAPGIPIVNEARTARHAAPTPARAEVREPRGTTVGRLIADRVTRLTQPSA
jgi:hypothetical protein